VSNKEELKAEVLKAQENLDIASLYVLEQQAHEVFDEETLHAFYANILDLALERLTEALEIHRVMDMNEVQDFATLRALYEYAIEHYSADKCQDASALFEVLSGLSNDKKFSAALKFHWLASAENLSFDDFLEKIADLEATQNAGTFYISCFQEEAQKLLDNVQSKGE
jgi:pyrroloquinoline quinone (PQQ) biosynthesis protein C